jgi:hypothetical protein
MYKLFVAFMLVTSAAYGQKSDTSLGKPIFWCQVSDPESMFMGAEGPLFVLYDNGNVLYWRQGAYYLTNLDDDDLQTMQSVLHLQDTFFDHSRYYDATTDHPENGPGYIDCRTTNFFIRRDTVIRVVVYGEITKQEFRKRLPPVFLKANDALTSFSDDRANPWIPTKIQVLLLDFSYSTNTPVPWPKEWPDLNSPGSVRGEDVSLILLDKRDVKELQRLLKKTKGQRAILIDEKKYFVGYRLPIPGLY